MVGFVDGLPRCIKRYGQEGESCIIPKAKRQAVLQFMTQHSGHILKKKKTSWEVLGILPHRRRVKQGEQEGSCGGGGGSNSYGTFLGEVKKALHASFSKPPLEPTTAGGVAKEFKHKRAL